MLPWNIAYNAIYTIASAGQFLFISRFYIEVAAYLAICTLVGVVVDVLLSYAIDSFAIYRKNISIIIIFGVVIACCIEIIIAWTVYRLLGIELFSNFKQFALEGVFPSVYDKLLWCAIHLFVRSGERTLAQERASAELREATLRYENDALTYALNLEFLFGALARIEGAMRRGAGDLAGETVVSLAEHMRETLSRSTDPCPEPVDDEIGDAAPVVYGAPPSQRDGDADLSLARSRGRFLAWTCAAWIALFVLFLVWRARGHQPLVGTFLSYGPQTVIGASWCLFMERRLSSIGARSAILVRREAFILCVIGFLLTSGSLFVSLSVRRILDNPNIIVNIIWLEIAYVLPVFILWAGAYFALDHHRRETTRRRAAAEIREVALKARNAMLRQQISPHFLFNALNALYTLILDRRFEPAQAMVAAVRRFLDRAGDPGQGELVALSSELATQDAYLEIERARFGDRLRVERRIGEGLAAAKVPHLILQPLVENAVKYGVSRTGALVEVEIRAERAGAELVLQVRDSGPGEAPSRPPGLGVGLRNVEARLRSLYGEAGRLACRPLEPSGFLAEVRVPLVL